jgi:hypothetical protein
MTKPALPKSKPALRQRQAAALRENLKRRKAQEKARARTEPAGEGAAAAHDSAGIGDDKRDA